jgi:hypothetical protein
MAAVGGNICPWRLLLSGAGPRPECISRVALQQAGTWRSSPFDHVEHPPSVPAMSTQARPARMPEPAAHLGVAVAGAAALWVRDLLARPTHRGTVIHAGGEAIYLDLGDRCVGILSASAVAVPCGIRTQLERLPTVIVGQSCEIGDGRLTCGPLEVRLGRVVDCVVPDLTPRTAEWAVQHLKAPALQLPESAVNRLAAGDPQSVAALLGLGEGLTPLGDDVLAGWLAAMVAAEHPGRASVASEIARLAPTRTTRLSATLLECASRGEVVPEYADLITSLNHRQDLCDARQGLVRVGHTSGRGLLLGLVVALAEISQGTFATRRTA